MKTDPSPKDYPGHSRLMDRIYGDQRHIYDLTRRYFLLGRDTLLDRMKFQSDHHVLEIGCGTARNLIHIARMNSSVRLYGLDASEEMLKTARAKVIRAGLQDRIRLTKCLAEDLDYRRTFGCSSPFDTAFFSYALSMIPTWKHAIDAALANTKEGSSVWVVDFWDQGNLPAAFRKLLTRWLRIFHVEHRPETVEYFRELQEKKVVNLSMEPLYRRYAYLAMLEKR